MFRRYLIAPDKFKGSLSAPEAAAAIAAGIRRIHPDAVLDLCPIADGGEGFMETLISTLDGKWITCPAVDGLDREIASRYVLAVTPQGPTAILEMAETAGLWRLTADERDPRRATTRGVGMQIAHAVSEHAVTRIILGLGGSATNDGGYGMASALGVGFTGGDDLASIRQVDVDIAHRPAGNRRRVRCGQSPARPARSHRGLLRAERCDARGPNRLGSGARESRADQRWPHGG